MSKECCHANECHLNCNLVLRVVEKILDHKCHAKDKCLYEEGHVNLSTGVHEVFINTACQPDKVYLSADSCHQVCGANRDVFASCVNPGGFVLFADVKNESVRIDWLVSCKK